MSDDSTIIDDIRSINELFELVEESSYTDEEPEKISTILQFFNDMKSKYEPAIFILNVMINEGLFRAVFDSMLNILKTKNTFSAFSFLGPTFDGNIISVLTVDKESAKIIFNPRHLSRGKYDNSFFTIEVASQTEHSDRVREFVETNKFNFKSYIKTVSEKVKFSTAIDETQ